MKHVWLSWWQTPDMPVFELHTPWWISGYCNRLAIGPDRSICAALPVEDVEEAKRLVLASFDDPKPSTIDWRFAQLEEGPVFTDRFARADWMEWPGENRSAR